MAKNKYQYDTFGELVGALISSFMMAKAKTVMASKQQQAEEVKAALAPYLNMHNIGLLVNDANIEKARRLVIDKGLPALDAHYIIDLEPTADRKDIIWRLSERPDGPTDHEVLPVSHGFISQIDQYSIYHIIAKFLPNGQQPTTGADN